MTEDAISKFLEKSEYYLKENIVSRRGFVQNLCLISAAVASFSLPLYSLPFIYRPLLISSLGLFSFVIIVGSFLLKLDLEKDTDSIIEMRKAVLARDQESLKRISDKHKNKKPQKDYILDLMVYPLCGGVIAVVLAVFIGSLFPMLK